MFVESEYKDLSNRIELMLTRDNEELLTSWEISNFITQFSSAYYKNELLNTISLALNSGVLPENIIIMDDSFNYHYSYSDLDVISLNTGLGVQTLYHLGKPISLFPNDSIEVISLLFEFFRRCNEIVYRFVRRRIPKSELLEILRHQYGDVIHLRRGIDEVRELALGQLNDFTGTNHVSEINRMYEASVKKINTYKKDSVRLNVVKESLYNDDPTIMRQRNHSDLESKYFDRFFRQFANNSRPVVGVYYPETSSIQILCSNHINKTKRDSRFLDIKRISHDSPYIISIFIGISVAIPLFRGIKYVIDQQRLNNSSIEASNEAREVDEQLNQLINDLNNLPEFTANENIPNVYLRERIFAFKKQNDEKLVEPVKKYGFDNEKLVMKVLEIK